MDGARARSRILLFREINYGQIMPSNGSQSSVSSEENTYFCLGLIVERKKIWSIGGNG